MCREKAHTISGTHHHSRIWRDATSAPGGGSDDSDAKNQHANNGKQLRVCATRAKRTLTICTHRVMTTISIARSTSKSVDRVFEKLEHHFNVCLRFHDKLHKFKLMRMAINLIKCCHRWCDGLFVRSFVRSYYVVLCEIVCNWIKCTVTPIKHWHNRWCVGNRHQTDGWMNDDDISMVNDELFLDELLHKCIRRILLELI